jgi:3D-(3,5/4)-trihydroxycyclohexane-1,2-dione acylhydrolase (decyclizing)
VTERHKRLTVGQAIVAFLQSQYSERDGDERRLVAALFGIFGHGNLGGIGQALQENGGDLPYYRPCNEQAMVHTAAAFAKANARKATFACTSSIGPGATNMVTGAALATVNRLPVLLLPSDDYATRRQGPVLQELEHPVSRDVSVNDCFRPVSSFFDRILRPEQLLDSLPEAMRVLTDPATTGAVTISLPQDVQTEAADFPEDFFMRRVWRIERSTPTEGAVRDAVALLKEAQRPFAIAGGGVLYSEAGAELEALCERLRIPVGETAAGKGTIGGEASMLVGGCGVSGTGTAAELMRDADVVLCVGTRLSDFTTASRSAFQNPDVRFISVNANARDANKLSGLPVVADAREALRALSEAAAAAGLDSNTEQDGLVTAARERWLEVLREDRAAGAEALTQHQVIHALNGQMRAEDTVIAAAGTVPGDLLRAFDTSKGRCHLEYGYSCMGYEIPAAVGVRLAQVEGEVYALVGDGTYLMNPTELVTAVQERLKITVIICENHGYQSIHGLQRALTGKSFGNEFRDHEGAFLRFDLAGNAESLGVSAWRVESEEALLTALEEVRASEGPCVICAQVASDRLMPTAGLWWDVSPAEVGDTPAQRDARQEYEQIRDERQRSHLTPTPIR